MSGDPPYWAWLPHAGLRRRNAGGGLTAPFYRNLLPRLPGLQAYSHISQQDADEHYATARDIPVYVSHDPAKRVGRVRQFWVNRVVDEQGMPRFDLHADFELDESPQALALREARRKGHYRYLSIGTCSDNPDKPLGVIPAELSIVEKPRHRGLSSIVCYEGPGTRKRAGRALVVAGEPMEQTEPVAAAAPAAEQAAPPAEPAPDASAAAAAAAAPEQSATAGAKRAAPEEGGADMEAAVQKAVEEAMQKAAPAPKRAKQEPARDAKGRFSGDATGPSAADPAAAAAAAAQAAPAASPSGVTEKHVEDLVKISEQLTTENKALGEKNAELLRKYQVSEAATARLAQALSQAMTGPAPQPVMTAAGAGAPQPELQLRSPEGVVTYQSDLNKRVLQLVAQHRGRVVPGHAHQGGGRVYMDRHNVVVAAGSRGGPPLVPPQRPPPQPQVPQDVSQLAAMIRGSF